VTLTYTVGVTKCSYRTTVNTRKHSDNNGNLVLAWLCTCVCVCVCAHASCVLPEMCVSSSTPYGKHRKILADANKISIFVSIDKL
jgi:hypothetical protein